MMYCSLGSILSLSCSTKVTDIRFRFGTIGLVIEEYCWFCDYCDD
jgi:hypothetical protein